MDKKKKNYLRDIYYNPQSAVAFSGISKLFRYVRNNARYNFSRDEIKKWLQTQEVHTTNRLVKRNFKRRRVIVPHIDYMWDIDTASLKNLAKMNKGYGYFVLAIDIMSRFIWTKAIKTPSKREAKEALMTFIKGKRKPLKLRSDKGTEYVNDAVKDFCQQHNIQHFVTQNEVKANYAERAIQTIKGKIFRYMRAKRTKKWIDQLDKITDGHNNTYHRSIKQTPASVTKDDEIKLWNILYPLNENLSQEKVSYKFNIGDIVRISRLRQPFQRYYSEHWSNEYFFIKDRVLKQYIPTYTLVDYSGDAVVGTFYEAELQKIYVDKEATYTIEKVVRRRVKNGQKESLVRWVGWPAKFDTWIPTKTIKSYK